jgi:hypothetical protein
VRLIIHGAGTTFDHAALRFQARHFKQRGEDHALRLRSVPRAKQEEADQLTFTGGQLRERLRGPWEGYPEPHLGSEYAALKSGLAFSPFLEARVNRKRGGSEGALRPFDGELTPDTNGDGHTSSTTQIMPSG